MRALLVLVLVAAATWAPAGRAAACSCAGGNPRDRLQGAGAAFIGRLLEVEGDSQSALYTFAVDEPIKGTFAETLTIAAEGNGAACGFEVEVERPIGVLLHRWRHGWSSGLCSQIEPDELRSAVAPLTGAPDAGPVVALAGGSFGEAQVAALDAQGNVAAWGWGRGVTSSLSVCPGGEVALEHVTQAPAAGLKGETFLSVRNVGDLQARRLAAFPEDEVRNVYRVICVAPDASVALVASPRGLFLYRDGAVQQLADGLVYDAILTEPGVAYAIGKRAIVRVDLEAGDVRRAGAVDDRRLSLELSQDGTSLLVARTWVAAEGPSYVLIARLGEEPLHLRPVARDTVEGFPSVSLPARSLPADTFDVSALEEPIRIEVDAASASPDLDGPSLGPVAAAPRPARRAPADPGGSFPWWPWFVGGALLASGAVVILRRSR